MTAKKQKKKSYLDAVFDDLAVAGMKYAGSRAQVAALKKAARSFVAAEQNAEEDAAFKKLIAKAVKPKAPCPERDPLDGPGPCEFVIDEEYGNGAVCCVCSRNSTEPPLREERS